MTSEPSQADIMAAMQAGQFRSKAPSNTSLYSDIESSALTQEAEGSKTNARKIYCFREGCGSVILQKGAATYVESSSTILPNDSSSPFTPSDKSSHGFWHVPDPYTFDNIGFSRPDTSSTMTLPKDLPGNDGEEGKGGKVKWLICAECDLGPLGWGFEGGKEAWVGVERVRYGP